MTPPFPVERWAARNPRLRWPLVFIALLLLLGLAGGIACDDEHSTHSGPFDCINSTQEPCQ